MSVNDTLPVGEMLKSNLPVGWNTFQSFLIDELKRKPESLGVVRRNFHLAAGYFSSHPFNRQSVTAFFKERREKYHNKNSSLNSYVKLFKNIGKAYAYSHPKDDIYEWLLKLTYYPVEREYKDVLTTDEQKMIYNYHSSSRSYTDPLLEARYSAIFMTLGLCAMRISELCNLRWDDYLGDRLILRHTKTKESRIVPLVASLSSRIDKLPRYDHGYVFGSPRAAAIPTRVLYELKKRCQELGIKKQINNHTFRRTFITDAINNGEDVIRVSRIAGHRNTNTTNGYYYGTPADLLPVVERLPVAIGDATFESIKTAVRRFALYFRGSRFPVVMVDNEGEVGFVVKKRVVFGE